MFRPDVPMKKTYRTELNYSVTAPNWLHQIQSLQGYIKPAKKLLSVTSLDQIANNFYA